MVKPGAETEHLGDLVISHRFRGPPGSANGGYTCGRLAEYVGGAATVRLMKPPPLDIHMDVVRANGEVQLRHGQDVIARAWAGGPEIDLPEAPALASARQLRSAFAGHTRHAFPGCFVCGVDRSDGDGLLIHAGPEKTGEGARHQVACDWSPHASLCGDEGVLPDHLVWAALDCPGGWSFLSFDPEVALLGELSAELTGPVRCGQECVVTGWEIDRDGRKRHTGSAIYDAEGALLARARATWITIPPPSFLSSNSGNDDSAPRGGVSLDRP